MMRDVSRCGDVFYVSLRTFQFSPSPINWSGQKTVTLCQERRKTKVFRVLRGSCRRRFKIVLIRCYLGRCRNEGEARRVTNHLRGAPTTIAPLRTAQACISIFESTPQMQDGCRTILRCLLLRLRVLTHLTDDLATLRRRCFNIRKEGRSS